MQINVLILIIVTTVVAPEYFHANTPLAKVSCIASWLYPTSAMVEHFTHNRKSMGSNSATGTEREREEDREKEILTDRQADRQTDRHTERKR